MIRKEQLVNESNRMDDLGQNMQLRNGIFALEQEIRTVQTQLGEEIARQRGLEDAEVELTNRNDNVLRSTRIQRMSEGINALLAISNNGESRRDHTDIFFPITQNLGQEELEEKILQNIIHKKVIAKGNVSPSIDDDVGDEETMKGNLFLSPITCGDIEDGTTLLSSSIQNMCAICCDDYEEGDDIAYSRNQECHHFYHVDCILEWLMRDDHNDCPLCRSAFLVH